METNFVIKESKNMIKTFIISLINVIFYVFLFYKIYDSFPYIYKGPYVSIVLLFIAFFVTTFTIGKLFEQLLLSFFWRFVSVFAYYSLLTAGIWLTIYETFSTNFNLEKMFFSTISVSFVTAVLISIFCKCNGQPKGYFQQIKEYLQRRKPYDWFLRLIIGVILLFITYYLLNKLIFPFIEPYYNSHSTVFLEKVNNGDSYIDSKWMWVQALVILITFIPLFALWRGSKSSLLFWVGFPLFLMSALGPFIINLSWPLGFRFTLLVEMTAILYMQSFIIVHLFYVPKQGDFFGRGSSHELKINKF